MLPYYLEKEFTEGEQRIMGNIYLDGFHEFSSLKNSDEPKVEDKNGGIIYERFYNLALEMSIDILERINNSGKRVTKFQINEVKKEDGRCYYEIIWV